MHPHLLHGLYLTLTPDTRIVSFVRAWRLIMTRIRLHLLYLYLVMRHNVQFRQQLDAVLPPDQNALQCLAVLLHLYKAQLYLFIFTLKSIFRGDCGNEVKIVYQCLHLIASKDTIQDEISPEHGPLALDILKQLEFCWIVVQPRWILVRKQPQNTAQSSSSIYTDHSNTLN